MNYTHAVTAEYGLTAADRVLQFASVSYDAHVEEVYPCLTCGATLVLRSDDMLDGKRFLELCREWQLTFVTLPSGFWHELADAIETEGLAVPETLRTVVIGGEQAMPERIAQWFDRVGNRVRLLNTYGPTETTVGRYQRRTQPVPMAGWSACRSGGRWPTIGPMCWTRTAGRFPSAFAARLYIGGESLARGYLYRPELTTERFVSNPFAPVPGARMYRYRRRGPLAQRRPAGVHRAYRPSGKDSRFPHRAGRGGASACANVRCWRTRRWWPAHAPPATCNWWPTWLAGRASPPLLPLSGHRPEVGRRARGAILGRPRRLKCGNSSAPGCPSS